LKTRKEREREASLLILSSEFFFLASKVTSIELFVLLKVSYNKTINEVDFAHFFFNFFILNNSQS